MNKGSDTKDRIDWDRKKRWTVTMKGRMRCRRRTGEGEGGGVCWGVKDILFLGGREQKGKGHVIQGTRSAHQ